MCRWRHKIWKIAVEILQSVNNRTQSLREIAYYALLLLTYIVINTVLGRVTLHPAGMHCPSWDDAFVSSSVCFCLSRSVSGAPCVRGVHSSTKHCVAVYCPISTWFSAFFQKGLLFEMRYVVLISIARWRHNFREIAVKKFAKIQKIGAKVCAHHFV